MTNQIGVSGRADNRTGDAMREKHDGELAGRLDVRVWLRLLTCSTIVEKRLRRRFEDGYATTLPRFDVMAAMERRPEGLSMGELSSALLVSNGNVTSLVKQLVGAGLVESRPDPEDGRSSIVKLTDKGRRHFAELSAAHHAWIGAMFKGVSPEDLSQLYGLLAKVKASISAEPKARS